MRPPGRQEDDTQWNCWWSAYGNSWAAGSATKRLIPKELRPKLRPLSHPSLIRGRHPWRRALRRYMAEYDERDPEVALRFLTQLRQAGDDVRLDDAAAL